jgi:shikimate kinase
VSPVAVLVGAPGSGKTSVGTALAERLGVVFRDTDHDVEEIAGKPVPDIFLSDGEDAFRALERGAVYAAMRDHDGVLALGGGAVMDESTRSLLAGQPVVWLRVGVTDAAKRVGLAASRPLLVGNVRSQLIRLMEERAPLYQQVAAVTVDTDGRAVADIVDDVVAGLEARQP